jgi:hypothetical protein
MDDHEDENENDDDDNEANDGNEDDWGAFRCFAAFLCAQ